MARRLLGRTSVRDALDSANVALAAAGCDSPRLDAELLLAHVLGVGRAAIIAAPGRELEPDEARAFMDLAARRRAREPVAYILGEKGFRRSMLAVDPRVLVPRPETEFVVEAALSLPAGRAGGRRGHGVGRDRAGAEGRAARPRGARHGHLRRRPRRRARRTRSGSASTSRSCTATCSPASDADAVVSNPPYVAAGDRLPPRRRRFEPREALFGGDDGLDVIRRLVKEASDVPFLALEVGAGQAAAVAALMGAWDVELVRDLAGHERVVVGAPLSSRRCIAAGGVAVFPSDTVYGLACDPESAAAVERMYALKGRPPGKPSAVMFFDAGLAVAALPELGERTRALMARLLPGGVTLVLPNPRGRFPLAGGEALGLRVPDVPLLRGARPRRSCRAPPTLAGGPDARRIEEVPAAIREGADLVSTPASCPATPSTVIDLRALRGAGEWAIVRAGAVPRGPSPKRHECHLDRPYAGRADIRRAARRRWYRGAHDRTPARLLRAPARRGRP